MSTLAIEILFGCATRQISESTKPIELMLRDIVGVFGGAADPCHAPTVLVTFQARVTGHPVSVRSGTILSSLRSLGNKMACRCGYLKGNG